LDDGVWFGEVVGGEAERAEPEVVEGGYQSCGVVGSIQIQTPRSLV